MQTRDTPLMRLIQERYGGNIMHAAERLGLDYITLYRIATGRTGARRARAETLHKIARKFRVTVKYLLNGESHGTEEQGR